MLASVSTLRGCSPNRAASLSKKGQPVRVQYGAAAVLKVATASAESANLREPMLLATDEVPNRCVTVNRGLPARPRRVGMMITPFAAWPPSIAAAEAPFN